MTQAGSVSGNQNREIQKREWHLATFNLAEWDSAQMGKKGKQGIDKWRDLKGHTSAHPEVGNQPWTFKGIKAERRKEWEKTGNRTCRVIGTEQALLTIRRNRGTNGSPGMPEFHYKRRGRLRRKKAEIFGEKKISVKFCKRRENWGKVNSIASRYPVKSHYCTYSDLKRIKLCKFWRLK